MLSVPNPIHLSEPPGLNQGFIHISYFLRKICQGTREGWFAGGCWAIGRFGLDLDVILQTAFNSSKSSKKISTAWHWTFYCRLLCSGSWDKPVSYILLLRPVETCPIALTRKISTKHIKITKLKNTWSISWLYITVLPSTKVIEEYLRMLACSSCTSNVHIWAYI